MLVVCNKETLTVCNGLQKLLTHLHGKRYALFLILNTALVTHLMLVLTHSYYFTILVRVLYSLTNQSQNLCLELLLEKAKNDEEKEILQKNHTILSGLGLILGPIISGYLFDIGFGYTGILAAGLAFLSARLVLSVTKDEKDPNTVHIDHSVLNKAIQKVTENVKEINNCEGKVNWDVLLLKYLFTGSIFVFFSKFVPILKHNFGSSNIVVGYTGAYINAAVFAASYYVTFLKPQLNHYSLHFLIETSFLLIAVLMLLACYAPYYELFMLLLILVIFLRTFITTLWGDLFSERKNSSLTKLNAQSSLAAGFSIPILFGIVCNAIAHNAVILFSCLPMFLCWLIVRFYTKHVSVVKESQSTTQTNKKDS